MATWSIPSGKEITGSTYIKDTDNNISDTIDDLVAFVNGSTPYNSATGLTFEIVDLATSQTITGVKTVDTGGAIDFTNGELRIGSTAVTATASELNILDGVTATTAELNILDGVTSTASELNILDGVTATASELNLLDGATLTTAELNILDGVTSTAAELNILDGATLDVTELNYVDGVTSSIQTQLDAKAPLSSPALTDVPTAPTAATGTDTTQIATTAFVQQEIAVYGWAYESAEQSMATSAGTISVNHGLGRIPYSIEVVFRCKVAEDGWSIGDELIITDDINSSGRRNIWKNATQVGLTSSAATTAITNKPTGSIASLTSSNWKLVFRAR